MNIIKVLVVDDSAIFRGLWTKILEQDAALKVVSSAADGTIALGILDHIAVDIVVLDLEMPHMDGLTVLPLILKKHPHIKVIIVSSLTTRGSKEAIKALTLGASDYIAKPTTVSASSGAKEIGQELISKIKVLAKYNNKTPPSQISTFLKTPKVGKLSALAIGASTGGPNALLQVLKNLPQSFHLPILIVQHMPSYFISALAENLSKESGRPCQLGKNGLKIENDQIYIAPGDTHMGVEKGNHGPILFLSNSAPENFCRPAVDPLFRSAALTYQSSLLALVLTGMGEDGKLGCEKVQQYGGTVLAQDEASSVVWGMPGAVVRASLADAVIPLSEIAQKINKIIQERGQ